MPEDPKPLPPGGVDPNVRVPGAVARAAAAANAFYERPADPPAAPEPAIEPAIAPVDPPAAPVTAAVTPPVDPANPPVDPPATPEEDQTWKQRYHSMKGRYDQSMSTIQGMQDQMRQMGDEIVALQSTLANSGRVAVTPQGRTVPKLITDKDREMYGEELLDTVQRAAMEAVAPQISALEQENQQLKRDVGRQRTTGVHHTLDQSVPNWRDINRSPRFRQWLSLTDLLSGSVRGKLLDAAFKAADAPRVVAFFQGFVNDEAATGSTEFAVVPPAPAQPPAPAPVPRQPAVALQALAAPGRARPAAQDTGRPAEKPVFTRSQIAGFYADVRKGVYAGRETEKSALETAIFAAQNEGRIRN